MISWHFVIANRVANVRGHAASWVANVRGHGASWLANVSGHVAGLIIFDVILELFLIIINSLRILG